MEIIIASLYTTSLTIGVGSSTLALVLFIRALADGIIDPSEKRFLHTVYVLLRIGMVGIAVSLLANVLFGTSAIKHPYIIAGILGILTLNAVLMTYRIMPMKYGPVLAGGHWYSLFFVSQTPILSLGFPLVLVAYALFILCFFLVFTYCKNRFTCDLRTYNGDVAFDMSTLEKYATDTSSFRMMPQGVYFPKTIHDVAALVRKCHEEKSQGMDTSLTVRAGGTCMSGGPLTNEWVIDLTRHMHGVTIDPVARTATVEMGAYFRDVEDAAAKHNLMFAPYPSSRRICGVGGMIGNNASGEKSLRHGATSDNVISLDMVWADGSIDTIRVKDIRDAHTSREQKILSLAREHGAALKNATGKVKKSASGYRLEKVIDGNYFSEIPLIVGSQGTLGIATKATLRLVPIPAHTALVLISATSLKDIADIVATVSCHNPEGLETFDIHTYEKAQEHLAAAATTLAPFVDAKAHLFILAQFSEETEDATHTRAVACFDALTKAGYSAHHITDTKCVDAAWEIRRNSFLLMRDHNQPHERAIPCIEDVIVPLSALGTFVTELRKILKKHAIHYGYHGHIGDGSLRVIPIFDFTDVNVGDKITALMVDVFALIKKLKGNISADHSDGIIRSPFLKDFYGDELYGAFEEIKRIYDPETIMNPRKKVGVSREFLTKQLNVGVVKG